jgi:DNA-binding NarL/FixJ family response regulator
MKAFITRKDIRILIIEDEALLAMSLKFKLNREGYSVCETAVNSREAFERFKDESPDIILADIVLADDDNGIDIAMGMKKSKPDLPVIFLTGYEIDDIKDRALVVNPLGFFIKPADVDEISRTIDDNFKIKR